MRCPLILDTHFIPNDSFFHVYFVVRLYLRKNAIMKNYILPIQRAYTRLISLNLSFRLPAIILFIIFSHLYNVINKRVTIFKNFGKKNFVYKMLKKNNFTKHFLILINNVVLVTYCIQNHFRGIVIQDTYLKLQYSSMHNYSTTSCVS